MTDEKEYLTEIDKCSVLHHMPFRVHPDSSEEGTPNFKREYRTGYAYWNAHKLEWKEGKAYHMVGFDGTGEHEGKFFARKRYAKKDDPLREFTTVEKRDFLYTVEMNGKQVSKNYFEEKFIGRIEFLDIVEIPVWDSDARKEVKESVKECRVVMTKNLYGKLCEQYEDPRTNLFDYMTIDFGKSRPPADMYQIKFHQVGQPFAEETGTTTTPSTPKSPIHPHEIPLIADYNGDETTLETLIQAIIMEADNRDLSITDERAAIIASAALVNGVVQVPA